MENFFDMTSVVAITVIAYLFGVAAKAFPKIDNKFIPIICGIVGGILGIVGLYLIPEFPVNDPISAIAVGIVSGLGATGVNQIGKQLLDKEGTDDE